MLPFVLVCGCHSLEHSKAGASRCRSLQPAGPSFPVQPLKNAYAWAPHQTHSTSILGWGLGICVVTDLAGDSGAASKTGCVAAPPAFQMQHLSPSAHGRCCRDPPMGPLLPSLSLSLPASPPLSLWFTLGPGFSDAGAYPPRYSPAPSHSCLGLTCCKRWP